MPKLYPDRSEAPGFEVNLWSISFTKTSKTIPNKIVRQLMFRTREALCYSWNNTEIILL